MKKSFILFVLVSFAMVSFFSIPVVKAEEQKYDDTICYGGTYTVIYSTDELKIIRWEARGVARSNIKDSPFGDAANYATGISWTTPENKTVRSFFTKQDEFGFMFWEASTVSVGGTDEGTHTFLHGTGKYKGMKGKGTHKVFTRPKPFMKGSFHFCLKATGTVELAPSK